MAAGNLRWLKAATQVAEIGQYAVANPMRSRVARWSDKIFCLNLPYRRIEVSGKVKFADGGLANAQHRVAIARRVEG